LEDTKEFYDQWGKPREHTLKRRRRIKIATIAASIVAVLLLAFWGVYSFTDLVYKPDTNVSSAPTVAGDWAMFGRDPVHSGGINNAGAALQGNVKTLLTAGDILQSSPSVSNGVVYCGSRDGKLYAVDIASGNKRWEFQTGSWVESSAAIVNNIVYFGSNDGNLYALNASTGAKIWSYQAPYPIKSSPAVADGRVYFGCDDYYVYALDAVNGKKIWSVSTGDVISSSPVIANGLVYFGDWDSYFYVLDARKGRLHLQMPSTKPVVSSAIVEGSTVYFVNSAGMLLAMDGNARNWMGEKMIRPNWQILYIYGALPEPPVASGFLWSVKLGAASAGSPTLAGGKIYAGAGKKVVAVDIQSRQKVWETDTGANINSTPIVFDDKVYAAAQDGRLYVLNASTGEKLKEIVVGGEINSTPAMVDGTLYITSYDKNLYAVK
jgi:outer membrane protein assembly factor BamB